jgi:predicted transposase/invertase (TIGR01784 family)
MHLANLDNEIFFKKVFTDPEVFRAFVKDITGVDVVNAKIETEKQLERKVAAIRFKLDIYAESVDKRVLIEIQRVDYDYTFDRFLHYFLAALVDLQRSSKDYSFGQDVYTIIVITAPYIVRDKFGTLLQDDVLISNLNPRTLEDKVREVYPHRLIFLNPSHPSSSTPSIIKDWLDLISESIKNPKSPNINLSNLGIQKAANLADLSKMPESVLEDAKIAEARKKTKSIYEYIGKREREVEIAKKMKEKGFDIQTIQELTGLSQEDIEKLK